MITDEMIKTEFVHRIVSRDMKRIYATQADVVNTYLSGGTGRLKEFLTSAPFQLVTGSQFEKVYHMRLFNYLRFLDIKYRRGEQMKLRRNLHLYNRVVWGVLKGDTEQDILYGFTQEVRKAINTDLEEALKEQ